MADLTSRPDSWMDYLPGNWQQAINTNPLLNALGRATSRPTPDLTRGIEYDQYGSVSDRNWLLEQARGGPPKLNPLAAEMLDKGGLLANFLGPGVKLPAAAPKPTGIRAYHGSPHDFDKFDISKIGTGEGAQAYGRGLYFAENEGVARSYRDNLIPTSAAMSGIKAADGKPTGYHNIDVMLAKLYGGDWDAFKRGQSGISKPLDDAIAEIDRRGGIAPYKPSAGRMYEVNIKADPDQFLDWDKPLSQQPEGVRKALPGADPGLAGDRAYRLLAERQRVGQRTGDPLDDVLLDMPITDHDAAARRLRDAGIPGIKYLDQGSRNMDPRIAAQERHIAYLERQPNADPSRIAEQRQHLEKLRSEDGRTRNYVVFDDKLIEILRKYGLLPPVAAGTAAALNQQEPQQ